MRLPPAEVLLSWPESNYDDPQTRGDTAIIVNSVFLGITSIVVALRLYARAFIKRKLGWEDFFIVVAFTLTIGLNICFYLGFTRLGWDRHVWDIPTDLLEDSFKLAYATNLIFSLSTIFTAFSLLAFYNRIGSNSSLTWFSWCIFSATVFTICLWTSFFLIAIFQCSPVSAYWTIPPSPHSRCLDEKFIAFGGGLVKLCFDFLLTSLPIPLVFRSHIPRRQKMVGVALLMLGYAVCAAGIVRQYYVYQAYWKTWDRTWSQYPAVLSGLLENDLSIICACGPALRPFVEKWWSVRLSSHHRRTSSVRRLTAENGSMDTLSTGFEFNFGKETKPASTL